VLGTALFRGGAGLESPATLPVDFEMVLSFTWVHVLAFLLVGVAAARLLALAERDPNFGFGIVLTVRGVRVRLRLVCMVFAEPVLRALTWREVLVGNLLAAASMATVVLAPASASRDPSLSVAVGDAGPAQRTGLRSRR
jgi:hypothetical protein